MCLYKSGELGGLHENDIYKKKKKVGGRGRRAFVGAAIYRRAHLSARKKKKTQKAVTGNAGGPLFQMISPLWLKVEERKERRKKKDKQKREIALAEEKKKRKMGAISRQQKRPANFSSAAYCIPEAMQIFLEMCPSRIGVPL